MKKIYLAIAGAFLIILIIVSIILSSRKKSTVNTQKNSAFPTSVPLQGNSVLPNQTVSLPPDIQNNATNLPIDISNIPPVETEDFKLQYFPKQNKVYLERKTVFAEQKFAEWANQNNYPQLINNPDLVSIVNIGQAPLDFNPMIEFLNIFMNLGQGSQQPGTVVPSSAPQSSNSSPSPSSSFIYYPQCGEFGETPLPDGCNLCSAGCGPTTVSMIAASYLGSNITPKTIVQQYQSKGYLLGCGGSRYSDAKQVLQSLGLKTTDYLVYNFETADQVVPDLRKYLDAGWTLFTLASFCNNSDGSTCGHYFWITDIDSQGNIWAYDPAYGRYEIPYNENSRYPYPMYRLAFGVKK